MTRSRLAKTAAVLLLAVALPLAAAKKTPTSPGKYEDWGPDIDTIEIVQPFHTADYAQIVVEPLDVSSTPPPEDADMQSKVTKVLEIATEPFAEGVKKGETGLKIADKVPQAPAKTLIVRAKVTTMDPGSRAKRLWVGYGAGAARAAISGEIVDAATGKVLVRFTQERRSGMERFGRGSSYEEIMKRNLQAIGTDVAKILTEF